jgi:hypothetical protein
MNWYLVQYADEDGMVYQWAQADTHLCAAADVLIDRGFNPMLHTNDDTLITVVQRDSYVAGNYTRKEVEVHADRMLELLPMPTSPEDPTTQADWWKE